MAGKNKKTISIYDPARDAYFEGSLELAKKYLASLKTLKSQVAAAEAESE